MSDADDSTNQLTRRSFSVAAAASAVAAAAGAGIVKGQTVMKKDATQLLIDRMDVIDTVNRVAMLADARDWAGLREVFDSEVTVDYTSIAGGRPATMKADDLIAAWKPVLGGFEGTRHVVGTHVVTLVEDRADCQAAVIATHYLPSHTGESLWMVGGSYKYQLRRTDAGWRITHTTFTCQWGSGNQSLAMAAAERGKAAK